MCPDKKRAVASWQSGVLIGFWVLSILAISGPTWRLAPSPFEDDPPPLMILFCANETMELTDPSPSRLEQAQLKLNDLIEQIRGTPVGLVAYAGSAHLVLPPTKDSSIVAELAAELDPSIMPNKGNALERAIDLGSKFLPSQQGTLLIISDDAPEESSIGAEFKDLRFVWHAIGHSNTPEWERIERYGESLRVKPIALTADNSDIDAVAMKIRRAQMSQATGSGSERWEEPGWWLLPIAACCLLLRFRREGEGN